MHGKDQDTLIEQSRIPLDQPMLSNKDQDTLIEQSQTALDQPMLSIKDQDTLIEQSPWYEILYLQ